MTLRQPSILYARVPIPVEQHVLQDEMATNNPDLFVSPFILFDERAFFISKGESGEQYTLHAQSPPMTRQFILTRTHVLTR